ncbi:MAG: alginate export family protein [Gemmatimonadaceae bacterium]|nr:alginate export family protein [Gemmatimonadaceae bacterium]
MLALGIEEASGERATTPGQQEAFAVLYPAAHSHGGYADIFGRANLRELHLLGTWDPFKAIALRGALYRFDRLRADDGVYTKQNVVYRAATGSRESHVADELDLTGTWKLSRNLRVVGGGGVVVPGSFLRHTPGNARTERWGFAGTTFTF